MHGQQNIQKTNYLFQVQTHLKPHYVSNGILNIPFKVTFNFNTAHLAICCLFILQLILHFKLQ